LFHQTLEELQQEMQKVLAESKTARKLAEREHQAEIERLKECQESEIALLKDESQKVG